MRLVSSVVERLVASAPVGAEAPRSVEAQRPQLVLTTSARRVTGLIVALIAALAGAHIVVTAVVLSTGHDYLFGARNLVDLDREQNLPTLFATMLVLFNAALCALSWRAGRVTGTREPMWLVLAAVLTFVAVDEATSLHEGLVEPLRRMFRLQGVFYFAWVIPYLLLTAVLLVAFVPFLRRLPSGQRLRLVVAGSVYVVGAAGLEMIAGPRYEQVQSKADPIWIVLVTAEELLELAGMTICAHALLSGLADRVGALVLRLDADRGASGPSGAQLNR